MILHKTILRSSDTMTLSNSKTYQCLDDFLENAHLYRNYRQAFLLLFYALY